MTKSRVWHPGNALCSTPHHYYYCYPDSCLAPLLVQGTELSMVERSMKDHPGPTPGRDQRTMWKEGAQSQGGKVSLEACPGDGGSEEASWWGRAFVLLFQEPMVARAGLGVRKGGLVGKSFQLRTGNPGPWSRRDDTPQGPGLVPLRMLSL